MSFSVPTSPAVSRSTKAQPVTPQRAPPRHQPRSQSFYRSPLTPSSPYTPISLRSIDSTGSSTLTTPDIGVSVRKRLAFAVASPEVARNANTSKDRSIADIAHNWRSRASENGIKVSYALQDDSSYGLDESSDMSLSDTANDSSILSADEALLAAPFLSTHRRLNSLPLTSSRPRAQSHASLPPRVHSSSPVATRNMNRMSQNASPVQRRTLGSHNHSTSLMATPPPNRALVRQLKLKGSMTDPPQPRRREALGSMPIPSNNIKNSSTSMTLEPDTSLDLFDIDENDFECEPDYQGLEVETSFSHDLPVHHPNSFGYPTFAPPAHQVHPQNYSQPAFSDPFPPNGNYNELHSGHLLNTISESVEHHFHAARQQPQNMYFQDMHQSAPAFYDPMAARMPPQFNQGMSQAYHHPAFVPVLPASVVPIPATSVPRRPVPERSFSNSSSRSVSSSAHAPPPTDCSVCLAVQPSSLAVLQPCGHPLCSTCLTSALNIVGEKDIQCAVCKRGVSDFTLMMGTPKGNISSRTTASVNRLDATESSKQTASVTETFFSSSPNRSSSFGNMSADESDSDLASAFEFGLDFGELRASTPRMEQQSDYLHDLHEGGSQSFASTNSGKRNLRQSEENVVLRIDNVPWDITPSQISRWLQQPVERVHVLLDGKGKTLSHAYVEVKDAATAGAILRGEVASSSGKKERGSVLGQGRRARGVTITRSGQQELMSDLFPQWRGNFDGSRPSLAGLGNEALIGALEGGFLSVNEVSGLLRLIREPDSHFLKVPSLPFHSLISILSKFPTDVDSRVFWSPGVVDLLFEATHTAILNLLERIEKVSRNVNKSAHDQEYTPGLVVDLLHTALKVNVFTSHQVLLLTKLANAHSLPLPEREVAQTFEFSEVASSGGLSAPRTPLSVHSPTVTLNQLSQAEQPADCKSDDSLDDLAKEFGVDAQVVQALAQRLAKLG